MLNKEQKDKIKYLKQIKTLDKGIDRKIFELEKWQTRSTNITSVISDMPHGSNISDKIADCVANIADIDKEINECIDKYVDLKKVIEEKINAFDDDRLKNIMLDKYINYWTWEEIAYRNNYSWQHVYRLHEQALNILNM